MTLDVPPLIWHTGQAPATLRLEPLGEGDSCTCYLLNGTHVLRVARHAAASRSLQREQALLPLLAEGLGVNIPQPEGSGVRLDNGLQFVCYRLLSGTELDADALAALAPACRGALMAQLARFVRCLHATPLAAARACGLEERDPRRFLPALLEAARPRLATHLGADTWAYYQRLVERYLARPELHRYLPCLLHGDLSPDHLLGDPARCALTSVIDFGDSCVGDPCWDLIYLLEDYGRELLELFLRFYAPERDPHTVTRIQLFQQLNNLDYCLVAQARGDQAAFDEALAILVSQRWQGVEGLAPG